MLEVVAANTLRFIENVGLGPSEKAVLRCELAKEMEEVGNYEGGVEALDGLWRGVGERPNVEGLDARAEALTLLRSGTLTGWLGAARQIPGAQEAAKDLIGEGVRRFEALGLTPLALEAQAELALCYWREGAFDEARVVLANALSILESGAHPDAELKARLLIRSAVVEFKARQFKRALQLLKRAAPLVEPTDNHLLKGKLHVELALTYRNLAAVESREDYTDRALLEYAAASFHFEQAGHLRYSGRVENNLAYLFFKLGRFAEAHEHLDRAREIFVRLGDVGSAAQVGETRARVLLTEGRYEEAESAARLSAEALEAGEEKAFLAEALDARGIALARLGRFEEAQSVLEHAAAAAEGAGDSAGAAGAILSAMEELGGRVEPLTLCGWYLRANGLLEAVEGGETVRRLRDAARYVVERLKGLVQGVTLDARPAEISSPPESSALEAGPSFPSIEKSGMSLLEAMDRYEAEVLRQALEASGGSITNAARRLSVSHQTLSAILHRRHRDLLGMMKPRKRRQVTLIGKKS